MSEHLPLLFAGLAGITVVTLLVVFLARKRRKTARGLRAVGFDTVKLAPLRATGTFSGMDVILAHVTAFTEEDRDGDSYSYPVTSVRFAGDFAGRAVVRLPHWNAADRSPTAGLEPIETGDGGFDRTWQLHVGDEAAREIWSDPATRRCLKGVDVVLDLDMRPGELVVTLAGRDPARTKVQAVIRLAEALRRRSPA